MKSAVFPMTPTEELKQKIMVLDLIMPLAKLMDKEEGKGWDAATARRMERDYKRFLYLTATADTVIVPTRDIDDVWHQHIVDTEKYMEDCDRLFGGMLHHFPYFGLRGDADQARLKSSFEETKAVWEKTFGDAPAAKATTCSSSNCAGSCTGKCCIPGRGIADGTEEFRAEFSKSLPEPLPVF